MAMNIKSEEAHRLATEIAQITGTSLTEAVTSALREKRESLQESRRHKRVRELIAQMQEQLRGVDLPDHGELLYDSQTGLPK